MLNRTIAGNALAIGATLVIINARHDAHIMVHLVLVNFANNHSSLSATHTDNDAPSRLKQKEMMAFSIES